MRELTEEETAKFRAALSELRNKGVQDLTRKPSLENLDGMETLFYQEIPKLIEKYDYFWSKYHVQGVNKTKQYQLLDEFRSYGKALAKKMALALGYTEYESEMRSVFLPHRIDDLLDKLYDINNFYFIKKNPQHFLTNLKHTIKNSTN